MEPTSGKNAVSRRLLAMLGIVVLMLVVSVGCILIGATVPKG
jgi:hypothetical protein